MFPGYGYRCSQPVIYYPSLALLSLGIDVLWVNYTHNKEPDYEKMQASEKRDWRLSNCRAALGVVLEQGPYGRFTLVGKSVGTLVIGDLLTDDPRLRSAEAI